MTTNPNFFGHFNSFTFLSSSLLFYFILLYPKWPFSFLLEFHPTPYCLVTYALYEFSISPREPQKWESRRGNHPPNPTVSQQRFQWRRKTQATLTCPLTLMFQKCKELTHQKQYLSLMAPLSNHWSGHLENNRIFNHATNCHKLSWKEQRVQNITGHTFPYIHCALGKKISP